MAKSNRERTPKEVWYDEERRKAKLAKVEAAQGPDSVYDGETLLEEQELQSDWQKLKSTAKIKFPAHLAAKFQLTPTQRLIAVAHCLGWTHDKIATASGLSRSTVIRYLNGNEDMVEFIKAFEYNNGTKDSKELIDNEQYASLQTLVDLRDNPSVSASTRKEIAVWMLEQKLGKAKERKEIAGVNLRELTEQLKTQKLDLALLEDEELSEPRKSN